MSIAQQIATPTPTSSARQRSSALLPAPMRRPAYTLVRIFALIAITSLGVALAAGTVAVAIMVVATNLGG